MSPETSFLNTRIGSQDNSGCKQPQEVSSSASCRVTSELRLASSWLYPVEDWKPQGMETVILSPWLSSQETSFFLYPRWTTLVSVYTCCLLFSLHTPLWTAWLHLPVNRNWAHRHWGLAGFHWSCVCFRLNKPSFQSLLTGQVLHFPFSLDAPAELAPALPCIGGLKISCSI